MTTPIIYAFTKAQERQYYLEQTIGPIHQETEAYEMLRVLSIVAPSVALILVPIQIMLIYLYNTHGHPWCQFFKQFNAGDRKTNGFGKMND